MDGERLSRSVRQNASGDAYALPDANLDYLLALSSTATDQIIDHIDEEESLAFLGTLGNRQEQLAALHAEAKTNFRGG